MKTLFIDSSRKSLSIAVVNSDELLFVSNVESYSRHSNFLLKEIINVLNRTGTTIYDIDNILVLNGPGSFTGIRVGVTVSKTLAWVLSKKIYVMSTLEAMMYSSLKNKINISVIPDRNNCFYVGIYGDNCDTYEGYTSDEEIVKRFNNDNISISCFDYNSEVERLCHELEKDNTINVNVLESYDYVRVVKEALKNKSVNPHLVSALYLKKIDAEKNKDVS